MLNSKQIAMIVAAGAVVVAGGVGVAVLIDQERKKKLMRFAPWVSRRLGGDDIEIEDEVDVHRLAVGPRPQSPCKRGGCASMMGRPYFGY